MNLQSSLRRFVQCDTALALLLLAPSRLSAQVPPGVLSYQGRVVVNGVNYDGTGYFKFSLVNGANGPTLWSNDATPSGEPGTAVPLPVTHGLYNVLLGDPSLSGMTKGVPADAFTNPDVRLRVWFGTSSNGSFPLLSPDQRIASVGYAFMAAKVPDGSITSAKLALDSVANSALVNDSLTVTAGSGLAGGGPVVLGGTVKLSLAAGGVTRDNLQDDAVGTLQITNGAVTGVKLASDASSLARVSGGALAVSGNDLVFTGNSLRTSVNDEIAFELRVGKERVLRFEPTSGAPNLIGGSSANSVKDGVYGATIAGGGNTDAGAANVVNRSYGFIGGGSSNVAGDTNANAPNPGLNATIGGGHGNRAEGQGSTVGGGYLHYASGRYSAVAGGYSNTAAGESSAVAGGVSNRAEGDYSFVGGGLKNVAKGFSSFAAGYRANANQLGSFVWGDFQDFDVASPAANSFTIRAFGGTYIYSGLSGTLTGVRLPAGSGSWESLSDRAAKDNFAAVNRREVLERLAAISIQSWNYKAQGEYIRHLGPVAQDFHAAFGLGGSDDRHISTVDADGVALSAIQGLYDVVKEDRAAFDRKAAPIDGLKDEVQALGRQVAAQQHTIGGLREQVEELSAQMAELRALMQKVVALEKAPNSAWVETAANPNLVSPAVP